MHLRSALTGLDQREEGRLRVRGAGRVEYAGQCVVREEAALTHEQQPVAAAGLVHDMAGDQQGGAGIGQLAQDVPEVAAQGRVQSHGRLVEDEQLGLADEGGSQGDSRQLPAGEVEHAVGGIVGEVHRGEDPLDLCDQLRLANPDDLGEVAHVLLDREVAVDARRLGEVADPMPQRRRPGWFAEDGDRSAGDDLDTDDGAHQRGLAAAVGTEQPDDLAARNPQVEVFDDGAVPAHDLQGARCRPPGRADEDVFIT